MNFLKATKEKFKEKLDITITTERQLPDGEYIIHFETIDPQWIKAWGEVGFTALTDEQIIQLYP